MNSQNVSTVETLHKFKVAVDKLVSVYLLLPSTFMSVYEQDKHKETDKHNAEMKVAPAFTDSFLFPLSYSKTSPVHFINRSINHWDSGPVMIWMINIQAVLQADLLPKCLRKCTRQWFKSLLEFVYQINYVFIFYFFAFSVMHVNSQCVSPVLEKAGLCCQCKKTVCR